MAKKVNVVTAVVLMAVTAVFSVVLTLFFGLHLTVFNLTSFVQRRALFVKLSDVDSIVRANYVRKLDETTLDDDVIRGYIAGTGDKHANYFDAQSYGSVSMNLAGKNVGIGVTVDQAADGNIGIVSVAAGSPALSAGLRAGDEIVAVGGNPVKTVGYDKAVTLLHGDVGTKAVFTVQRAGKSLPFTILRRQYATQTIDFQMIGNLAYIRIVEFDENTADQFNTAVSGALSHHAKGIIFDVRNNPGGELVAAESMLDRLLPKGPIVSATTKDGKTTVLKYSDANEVSLPMAVLTNANTASAAELFTQALKDYGKAKSIGATTYGKGTMQQIFDLGDGSAFSISIAYFNPPKSANFDGKGVKPDIAVPMSASQVQNLYTLSQADDAQLQAAIRYLSSKGLS